jgi:hypothetical protein
MSTGSLFKYSTRERLASVLTGAQLWFAPPARFHDPFGCSIEISTDYSVNSTALGSIMRSIAAENSGLISNERLREGLEAMHADPQWAQQLMNRNLSRHRQNGVGIACFSRVPDRILMWSHYAESHRGAGIELEPRNDPEVFKVVEDVLYSDEYPQLKLLPGSLGSTLRALLTTNARDWSYEHEVRVLRDEPGPASVSSGSVVSVTSGCAADTRDVAVARELLGQHGWTATLRKAQ